MTIPLRHFVVGIGFLIGGGFVGVATAVGVIRSHAGLAHVHLLLVGWICITIMGAMTQFVPVWSGTTLHSHRLAVVQLWLVTIGLLGFVGGLLAGDFAWVVPFGGLMLVGVWAFVYNVGRTLASATPLDVTERHFAVALGFFLVVTVLGFLLAVDFVVPVFRGIPVDHSSMVLAHATLAVFGVVLTTILGALYQLVTMFAQTDLDRVDIRLQSVETASYPIGVFVLALGRLLGMPGTARLGAFLVLVGLAAFGVVLGRRLYASRVDRSPMLTRYAIVAVSIAVWIPFAARAWLVAPLAPDALFGAPGSVHLLAIGVVGFVVLGTLYHVVPFIIWVHRYSDLLGYERVPMVDDLYDDRIATIDVVSILVGGVAIVLADTGVLPSFVFPLGGIAVTAGFLLFAANMLLTIREHSPNSGVRLLFGTPGGRTQVDADPDAPPDPR